MQNACQPNYADLVWVSIKSKTSQSEGWQENDQVWHPLAELVFYIQSFEDMTVSTMTKDTGKVWSTQQYHDKNLQQLAHWLECLYIF